jgi:hypothetical protein
MGASEENGLSGKGQARPFTILLRAVPAGYLN